VSKIGFKTETLDPFLWPSDNCYQQYYEEIIIKGDDSGYLPPLVIASPLIR
jgi:hypothetical protein